MLKTWGTAEVFAQIYILQDQIPGEVEGLTSREINVSSSSPKTTPRRSLGSFAVHSWYNYQLLEDPKKVTLQVVGILLNMLMFFSFTGTFWDPILHHHHRALLDASTWSYLSTGWCRMRCRRALPPIRGERGEDLWSGFQVSMFQHLAVKMDIGGNPCLRTLWLRWIFKNWQMNDKGFWIL